MCDILFMLSQSFFIGSLCANSFTPWSSWKLN